MNLRLGYNRGKNRRDAGDENKNKKNKKYFFHINLITQPSDKDGYKNNP
jgi:hypothetical protein